MWTECWQVQVQVFYTRSASSMPLTKFLLPIGDIVILSLLRRFFLMTYRVWLIFSPDYILRARIFRYQHSTAADWPTARRRRRHGRRSGLPVDLHDHVIGDGLRRLLYACIAFVGIGYVFPTSWYGHVYRIFIFLQSCRNASYCKSANNFWFYAKLLSAYLYAYKSWNITNHQFMNFLIEQKSVE